MKVNPDDIEAIKEAVGQRFRPYKAETLCLLLDAMVEATMRDDACSERALVEAQRLGLYDDPPVGR